ncbi:Flagellar hook-associated protein FlgL [Methylophaga frappieri]|uniref:Flagellar hook-associated protein FlgL n=1 Tax=Methylophaga frappieri (strain ATCC BAA-2434 / DSM 25690 / JAM7) TaxID=754477 RepID=I1YKM7_METFJ|nr:flagellar hook-associated protein FlgL [Methylophaga frappieri]AFJ03470.1 Flagellar hook-associated protein FlgL [Methylophaga frappieri]
MRISTTQIFDQNLSAMLEQQANLAKTQNQVSSGKRITRPSDDPVGAVRALNLQRELNITEQYLANATIATNKLQSEESSLKSAADILQRVRELAVQGLNDSNTQDDRKAIAVEIRQLNQQLLSLANGRDSNGDFVFAGFANSTQPYDGIFGSYQGDEGQRNLQISTGVTVATNDPGSAVFETPVADTRIDLAGVTGAITVDIVGDSNVDSTFAPLTFGFAEDLLNPGTFDLTITDTDGNTVTLPYQAGDTLDLTELNGEFPNLSLRLDGAPNDGDALTIERSLSATTQPVFQTISHFADALENDAVGPNDSPNNGLFLSNLSAALDNIVDKRAQVGGRLNAIEQQTAVNDAVSFSLKSSISEISDLDYAEAITRLTKEVTSLQAAQQTFAQVQNLSLFNFI